MLNKILSWFKYKKVDKEWKEVSAAAKVLPKPVSGETEVNPYVVLLLKANTEIFGDETYNKILEDYLARAEVGLEKYGTYLHTFNGRSEVYGPMLDAYQEALDGIAYTTQGLLENEEDSPSYRAFSYMRELFVGAAYIARLNMDVLEKVNDEEEKTWQ